MYTPKIKLYIAIKTYKHKEMGFSSNLDKLRSILTNPDVKLRSIRQT